MKFTTMNNSRPYPLGNSFGDVKKFLSQLKGEHNIMDLVMCVLKAKNNDEYMKKISKFQTTSEKVFGREFDVDKDIMIEDAVTDIGYQRCISIIDFIKWLEKSNGICKAALNIISTAKRVDKSYVYDGCHRSFMSALVGMKWLPKNQTEHERGMTNEEMREVESGLYITMNANKRNMKVEELWKAEVVSKVEEALLIKTYLEKANLDVMSVCERSPLSNRPMRNLSGFAVFKDMVTGTGGNSRFCGDGKGNDPVRRIRQNDLVLASLMINNIWPKDSTISAYIIGGLASLLHPDLDGEDPYKMEEIIDAHCNKRKPKTTQTDLIKNRLAGLNIESVGVKIGYNILNYDYDMLQTFYGLDDSQMRMLVERVDDEASGEESKEDVTKLGLKVVK